MVFDRMPTGPAYAGIPTFLKLPYVSSPDELRAEQPDAVVLGAPFDMGTTNRPGARFGPRSIRAASQACPYNFRHERDGPRAPPRPGGR